MNMSISADRQIIKQINDYLINPANTHPIIQSLLNLMKSNPKKFLNTIKAISAQAISNYKPNNKASQVLKILKKFLNQLASGPKNSKNNSFILEIVEVLLILLDTQDCYSRLGAATLLFYLLQVKKWKKEKKIEKILHEKTSALLSDKSAAIRRVAVNICMIMNFESDLLKFACSERLKELRLKSLEFVICGLHNLEEFGAFIQDVDNDVRSLVINKIGRLGIENLKPSIVQKFVFSYEEERCPGIKFQLKRLLFSFIKTVGLDSFLEKIDFITLSIQQQSEIQDFFSEYVGSEELSYLIDQIKNNYSQYLLRQTDDNIGKILVSVLIIEEVNKRKSQDLHEILDHQEFLSLLSSTHPLIPHFFMQSSIRLCLSLDIYEEKIRNDLLNHLSSLCISYPINMQKLSPLVNFENKYLSLEHLNYFYNSSSDVIQYAVRTIRTLVQQHQNDFFYLTSEILNEVNETSHLEPSEEDLRAELENIDEEIYLLDNECKTLRGNNLDEALNEKNEKLNRAVQIEEKLETLDRIKAEKVFRMIIITTEIFRQTAAMDLVQDPEECIETLVESGLRTSEEIIQVMSFECLTQILIHSPQLFEKFKGNYELALKGTDTYVEMVCVKSLFDIYMIYKPSQPLNVDIVTHDKVLQSLLRYCHNFNTYIKAVALEGFCKLIINLHIDSVLALTTLIFAYFNTNEEPYIKQILHLFFSNLDLVTLNHPSTILKSVKVFIKISCETLSGHSKLQDLNFSFYDIKNLFSLVWNSFDTKKYFRVTIFTYEMDILYFYLTEIIQNPFDDESGIYAKLTENIQIDKLRPAELWLVLKLLKNLLKDGENLSLSKILQQVQERIFNEELIQEDYSYLEKALKESYKSTLETAKVFKQLFMKLIQSECLLKSKKILASSKNSKKISVPNK